MSNPVNIVYDVVTDKRSVPFNVAGGAGTKFLTEMPAGSYLVDLTNWEVRKVVDVKSDVLAYLNQAFTNNLFGAAPQIIYNGKATPTEIELSIKSGSANGLLFNKQFSGTKKFSKANRDNSSSMDRVQPVIIDGTGTSIEVTVMY